MKRRAQSVLCIGRDPVRLNLCCSGLREHGWNVISSASGHEGILNFGGEHVDAVLLCLHDEGAEAAITAAELKRLRPSVPIIMLVRGGEIVAEAVTAQADAVVTWSDDMRPLLATLRSALRRR